MRAMGLHKHGPVEVLQPLTLADPTPRDFDLLVEVHASAMNPVDAKVRAQSMFARDFPLVLGYDMSGIVRGMGDKAQGFAVGDAVYGSPSLLRNGSNAELVLIDARTAAPKPAALDHPHAAALPLVVLTAWEALLHHARLHHGETVLIHGGAGGVGHVAIQLARHHGCRVIATAGRDESLARCRELGTDEVIDYRKSDVPDHVKEITGGRGADAVLETVGGDNLKISVACVAPYGRIVSILPATGGVDLGSLFLKNASLHFEFMGGPVYFSHHPEQQGQILRTVAELVDADQLKPHVSRVYPLDRLADAHREQESGHVMGKLAIAVR
jgi:NADPH2:quinone reductase